MFSGITSSLWQCVIAVSHLVELNEVKESPMIIEEVVELSRFQFALTAMYHFLFVPLTLGLAFILAIM